MELAHHRAGHGEPLVLLHGIGDDHHAFDPLLAGLTPVREVWALDLPGFGGSPVLAREAPTPAALAGAVIAFMRARGHETFHVGGSSTGGGVALEIGRLGAARSVVAFAPTGLHSPNELRYLRVSLEAARWVAARVGPGRLARIRRVAGRQLYERPQRIPAEAFAHTLAAAVAAPGWEATMRWATGRRFGAGEAPRCPVTVAWGEHDRLLLTRPQSARARALLPHARHVTLRGCGHVPFWDDPEQAVAVLLSGTSG